MKAVIQRVTRAQVDVDGRTTGTIATGLLVLLGAERGDTTADAKYLAQKICSLRIFADQAGKMNLDLAQVNGSVLAVSQFTLLGDCRKGRRPSFGRAEQPEHARRLYEDFVEAVRAQGCPCETGVFQANMQVSLTNDGPVTFILESRRDAAKPSR